VSAPKPWTAADVLALPVTIDVPTAGKCWGLGRDGSYRAARDGTFPVPVLPIGWRLVVTRASLLTALGISDSQPVAARGHAAA
jgi:hypothetical protein